MIERFINQKRGPRRMRIAGPPKRRKGVTDPRPTETEKGPRRRRPRPMPIPLPIPRGPKIKPRPMPIPRGPKNGNPKPKPMRPYRPKGFEPEDMPNKYSLYEKQRKKHQARTKKY